MSLPGYSRDGGGPVRVPAETSQRVQETVCPDRHVQLSTIVRLMIACGRGRVGTASVPARRRARGLAGGLALVCWIAVVGMWRLMVVTYTGQRIEHAALRGSLRGAGIVSAQARSLLSVVSMPAAVVLVFLILGVGLWTSAHRRALWAVAVVVAVNVSTQLLKHVVFSRPDYGLSWRYDGANTLPSGHTAMAASAAVALVLVVRPAWRPRAVWVGMVVATAMGYSTLVCQWHRPADVMAAFALAVGWAAFAIACGAWDGPAADSVVMLPSSSAASRRPLTILAGLGGVAAVVSAGALVSTWLCVDAAATSAVAFRAYVGGALGCFAVAAVGLSALAALTPADTQPSSAHYHPQGMGKRLHQTSTHGKVCPESA